MASPRRFWRFEWREDDCYVFSQKADESWPARTYVPVSMFWGRSQVDAREAVLRAQIADGGAVVFGPSDEDDPAGEPSRYLLAVNIPAHLVEPRTHPYGVVIPEDKP